MRRIQIILLICSFSLFVGLLTSACGGGEGASTAPAPTPTPSDLLNQNIVNVDMSDNPYRFEPKILELKRGINYTLVLKGTSEFHTYTVLDLNLNVNVPANETTTVQFTPTISGTFELVCVPHEHDGMVGIVNVSN